MNQYTILRTLLLFSIQFGQMCYADIVRGEVLTDRNFHLYENVVLITNKEISLANINYDTVGTLFNAHTCTGILMSEKLVLTAAHCVMNRSSNNDLLFNNNDKANFINNLKVSRGVTGYLKGSLSLSDKRDACDFNNPMQIAENLERAVLKDFVNVRGIYLHDEIWRIKSQMRGNQLPFSVITDQGVDLAVLELEESIREVRSFPKISSLGQGVEKVRIAGYGDTHKVKKNEFSNICKFISHGMTHAKLNNENESRYILAKVNKKNAIAQYGDSGGPMFLENGSLVGVASFSFQLDRILLGRTHYINLKSKLSQDFLRNVEMHYHLPNRFFSKNY